MRLSIQNKFKLAFGINLLKYNKLPTYIDLYRHYLYIFKSENGGDKNMPDKIQWKRIYSNH